MGGGEARGWCLVVVCPCAAQRGKTLRQRLEEDKAKWLANHKCITMGARYYADLKAQYAEASAVQSLEVADPLDNLCPQLDAAVQLARGAYCDKGKLCEWLDGSVRCSQREFVGICRLVHRLRPSQKGPQQSILLSFMRFVERLSLQERFPVEFRSIASVVDESLCCLYSSLRGGKVTPAEFWALHGRIASLVVSMEHVVKVVECQSRWRDVRDELASLCTGSRLGARMLSFAGALVLASEISRVVDEHIDGLKAGQTLSPSLVDEARAKVSKGVSRLPNIELLGKKREVMMRYRNTQFVMQVSTVSEEFDLKLSVVAKTVALQRGELPELWCESQLGSLDVPKVRAVAKDMLQDNRLAREKANQFLSSAGIDDVDKARQLIASKQGFLLNIDRTICVELAWMRHMLEKGGGERILDSCLSLLPTTATAGDFDIGGLISRVDALRQGPLFRVSSKGTQGQLGAFREFLEALRHGRRPPSSKGKGDAHGDFFCQVLARAQLLAEYGGGGGKADKRLRGRDAVLACYNHAMAKAAKGKELPTLDDISCAMTFGWVLDADQQAKLDELAAKIVKTSVGGAATIDVDDGDGKKERKQKKARKTEKLDDLFA